MLTKITNNTVKRRIFSVLLLFPVLLMPACSLMDIKDQADVIDTAGNISGTVSSSSKTTGQIYLKVYQKKDQQIELVKESPANNDGSYSFHVIPGSYALAGFIDANNNTQFDIGEPSTYISDSQNQLLYTDVKANQTIQMPALSINDDDQDMGLSNSIDNTRKIDENIGKVTSLDDAMFDRENASTGFWRPMDFIDTIGGGVLMLQEYDSNKTPVLFVHGIMGTPIEFKAIIDALDTEKFQPWVLYYPSGVRLDMVSDYMLRALTQLHAQYAFNDLHLIAHSMGGLMSRSYIMKHLETQPGYELSLFVTINSPLYGMDSAASGVANSPIVIPSWRDVASGSDYVKRMHQWTMPQSLPYHLIFSYQADEEGDGVVPIKSQLSLSLQDEAIKIYGFNAQHAGILSDKEFIKRLHKIISSY